MRFFLLTPFAFLLATSVQANDEIRVVRENIEWLDVWVPGNNAKGVPKVLLIGDSIARGYYKDVEDKLQGKAIVCRLATSKSLGDLGYLAEVKLVLGQASFDVIHVNNGLHGFGYSDEEYASFLPALFNMFKNDAPKAKVIWAQTTPVRTPDKLDLISEKTDRVKTRNKLALEFATKEKIPVNDLFALVADKPELYSKDGTHFNAKGSEALGKQVAEKIAGLLK